MTTLGETGEWAWKSVDGETTLTQFPTDKKELKRLISTYEFCLTGHVRIYRQHKTSVTFLGLRTPSPTPLELPACHPSPHPGIRANVAKTKGTQIWPLFLHS